MKNKKGVQAAITMLMSIILMGALLFFAINYITKQSSSVEKVTSGYIESLSNDFDGDRIVDFTDDSPCVAGEERIIATDGKMHYYFGDPVGQGDSLSCDFKDLTDFDGDVKLELKTEDSTLKKVCVLPEKYCAKWLKADYEKLRDDNK